MQDYGATAEEASESISGAFISASGEFRDYIQKLNYTQSECDEHLNDKIMVSLAKTLEEESHMLSTTEWRFDLPFKEFMDLISMHLGYDVLPQLSKGDYNVAFKCLSDTFESTKDRFNRSQVVTFTLVERSVRSNIITIPRHILENSSFKGVIITHDAGYQHFNKVIVSFEIADDRLLSHPPTHEVELAMWGL